MVAGAELGGPLRPGERLLGGRRRRPGRRGPRPALYTSRCV
ncbi:hypothetical protein [Arthrobacter sp. KBS0703]|nr:hypothetical protein [Arthrobacter sp. KBS0703]